MTSSVGGAPTGTTGGQYATTTGLTTAAANSAAQAQIAGAQNASNIAGIDTNSALQSLMNQYQQTYQLNAPTINTGAQATAQINYLLGLPAVNPGNAPTSPLAGLYQQAQGLGAVNPASTALTGTDLQGHVVTSEASQLMNQQTPLTQAQQGFVNQYQAAGGTSGETGQAFNAAIANNPANQAYNTQESLYNQYNAMGTATPQNINNIVTNLPGYQANQAQGISAIQNAASASGMLNSGNLLQGLDMFGQQLAGNYFNNYLSQLGGLSTAGNTATAAQSSYSNALGAGEAGLLSNLGTTQANAALAEGQAQASSYTSQAANQQVLSQYQGGGVNGILGGLGGAAGGVAGNIYGGPLGGAIGSSLGSSIGGAL